MKIQLMSDVHFEWQRDQGMVFIASIDDPSDVDVLVLAGDIIGRNTKPILRLAEIFPNIVYVAGNHEYYDTDVISTQSRLRNLEKEARDKGCNFHFLDRGIAEIGGKRFLGTTLWFKEENVKRAGVRESWLNDFYQIGGFKPWVYDEYERNHKWLNDNVQEGDIVVTHHLPHHECIAPKWRVSPYNCFFASDQNYAITQKKPAYWFFGHTHDSVKIKIGDTLCVCNPYGYDDYETNREFDFGCKIEI